MLEQYVVMIKRGQYENESVASLTFFLDMDSPWTPLELAINFRAIVCSLIEEIPESDRRPTAADYVRSMFSLDMDSFGGWEMLDINGWKTVPSTTKITAVIELCNIEDFLELEDFREFDKQHPSAFTQTSIKEDEK